MLHIAAPNEGEFDIVIVGYDYPSGFSILCGLLSAFGLDIRAGEIYSFSKQSAKGSPGRIVDVLKVTLKPGEEFRRSQTDSNLSRNSGTLTELLASGSHAEARERLNRFLIESIEKMGEGLVGLVAPVDLTFDNQISSDWTLMEVRVRWIRSPYFMRSPTPCRCGASTFTG